MEHSIAEVNILKEVDEFLKRYEIWYEPFCFLNEDINEISREFFEHICLEIGNIRADKKYQKSSSHFNYLFRLTEVKIELDKQRYDLAVYQLSGLLWNEPFLQGRIKCNIMALLKYVRGA